MLSIIKQLTFLLLIIIYVICFFNEVPIWKIDNTQKRLCRHVCNVCCKNQIIV